MRTKPSSLGSQPFSAQPAPRGPVAPAGPGSRPSLARRAAAPRGGAEARPGKAGRVRVTCPTARRFAGARRSGPGGPSRPRVPDRRRVGARWPPTAAMSKLAKFFQRGGSSKGRAAPSAQEALARLRETEEMLGRKQEYLESRIQRELALARRLGTQNKRGRRGARPGPRWRRRAPNVRGPGNPAIQRVFCSN